MLLAPWVLIYSVAEGAELASPVEWSDRVIRTTGLILACLFVGQGFLAFGLIHADASSTSAVRTLDIPIAAVFGYIFLHEVPTATSIVGGVVIVAACGGLALSETAESSSPAALDCGASSQAGAGERRYKQDAAERIPITPSSEAARY